MSECHVHSDILFFVEIYIHRELEEIAFGRLSKYSNSIYYKICYYGVTYCHL